uniref:AlNc14C239G9449 protein n=1 Tax=Albugo laibachii Nc14 TaxID=890382 RepID=F0WSV8_9STRA|nr:AlNc14C239G9449 [Albugo laibachii Nc14]|eukprot:CCA24442.1 AlNc14C239G9449 [Albugo laibachii Nc14]
MQNQRVEATRRSVPLQQTFKTGLALEQLKEESGFGRYSEECDINDGDREDQKQENERNRLVDRDSDEKVECNELKLRPGNGETSDATNFDDTAHDDPLRLRTK